MFDYSCEKSNNIPSGKIKVVGIVDFSKYCNKKGFKNATVKINIKEPSQYDSAAQIERHLKNGEKFISKHKLNDAIAEYNKALAIDSTCVRAYNKRGHAYFSIGKWKEALSDFSMILSLAPDKLPCDNRCEDYERWMKTASRALKKPKAHGLKSKSNVIHSDKFLNFKELCDEETDK